MMSNGYRLSHIAEQDIDEIISFIAERNVVAAHEFVDVLYDSFATLAENPLMGHVRQDLTEQTVRFWPFKWHYLVDLQANRSS